MKRSTLLFLIKGQQVLLAMKKRSFGINKWNGVGGKPNKNEKIKYTAIRETQEEINVTPKNIKHLATINFYYKNKPEWNQQVWVYITTNWNGEPSETEEMKPQWFDQNKLPFKSMWPDDPFWLPLILSGKKVKASFTIDENDKILNKTINEI
ncbi:MAG: 8-oxo-dGTP diphosphatase [Candidatus Shapirobacteria bacterium]|nr:8-oxo-dGTP diphosphatase [Candidatus Shapirobacteria bacterium]